MERRERAVKAAPPKASPDKHIWAKADKSKFTFSQYEFSGHHSHGSAPRLKKVKGKIEDGENMVRENPEDYEGVYYKNSMKSMPEDHQRYTLVRRTGSGFKPKSGSGSTYFEATYHALPSDVTVDDNPILNTCKGRKLPPLRCPGRGVGCCDSLPLAVMEDPHPNDIKQGNIGDCWFLSAVAALAEHHGAIRKLFRCTKPDVSVMPQQTANTYTVTLYDLTTWEPTDVIVNEGLSYNADDTDVLGAHANPRALWVNYLEKAAAVHCGGWDKIWGGHATHAFSLLTGSKETYTIQQQDDGSYKSSCNHHPTTGKHEHHHHHTSKHEPMTNSPHDCSSHSWEDSWPEVGGGGYGNLNPSQLFERMCAWDDSHYLMCASTPWEEEKEVHHGLPDNHEYTIMKCHAFKANNGDEVDLVKMRNPWGHGEFTGGKWIDRQMGAGWSEYPEIKKACDPLSEDDGVFWLSKDEFFEYYQKVNLCAHSMKEFVNS